MAHGWNSYFHDLPPLSSDPSTLRRTSESEGSISQHIENFIGHHDFPGAVASHEAPATNSNFNTNYYSNPSIENPSSDCLYQRYCKETQWQTDGEQMEKDYCGNISDFATDGLSTSESFPSSFATDLHEFKQDCGMLATSFLEDYSDVSSCSDADVGETRPSCKFMASNSVPKAKTTKPSSSEWLFTDTGNIMLSTESLCPNMSETNEILPSTSNVTAGENIVECAQDKLESSEKHIKDQDQSTSNMVPSTRSETVEDRNDYGACLDQKQKDVTRDLTQGKNSNNLTSGDENLTGDGIQESPDVDEEEQIAPTSPNIMTTLDNEQYNSDEKVLKEEMKESFNQENEGFDHPNSTDCQDRNTREDVQETSEDLERERKESSSFENETFDEQKSSNTNSTDGQDDNMETDCQEKEIQSTTSQSSDQLSTNVSDSKDVTHELRECTSTSKKDSHDAESCLQKSAVESDVHLSNTGDKNEQNVASHSESCLQPNSSRTAENPCPEEVLTNAAEKTNTTFSPDPDCNGPGVTSDSLPINTSDKNKQGSAGNVESCLQSNSLSSDMNSFLEKETASPPDKKTTTSSSGPVCTDPPVTSDDKEQSVSDGLESCSESNASSTDLKPCLEKQWTSPKQDTNATPDQQQPVRQSPIALEPVGMNGDVAENSRESFEELDTSLEGQPVLGGVLYGEPLSREDSSCDADETKLDTGHYKNTSVASPDSNKNYSEGQSPQLKSSIQMRKRLQPVVILKTSELVNGTSNSYHCADCQHTTHSVDHLIEHHHCCRSVDSFQFCTTCNLYLMSNEQTEQHVCCLAKESPQLSSESSLPVKKKRSGRHRCIKCDLVFSKLTHYIRHMRTHTGKTPYKCNGCGIYFAQSSSLKKHKRILGRCKQTKLPVANSDAIIKETETPPQKDLVENKPYSSMPECYIKLVDISKTHLCSLCGKCFLTAARAKKHFYSIHRKKSLAVSSSKCTTKQSGEKTKNVKNETTGKYKCPLCPRLFKYSYNRARHLRDCVRNATYGGKGKSSGKYRCPLCHVTFTLPSNRYRHIKTFCLRECVDRLAKEAKSKEPVEQKKTKEIEPKKNEQKKMVKEMEQKKQAPQALPCPKTVPLYKCNLCPAVFRHASGKYRHMKKHELFKLTGKMFRYRNSVFSTLSKPASLSSTKTEESKDSSKSTEANGSLALSCHFCGSCFNTPQSLKKHERNHRGERPYRCLECGKHFKKRTYLIGHKRVHQRRIQCTVCRKILPTIRDLIQHRSSHLKRGMLQCPDCNLQFQYPAHLLRHLDSHKRREKKASQHEERPPLKSQQSLESVKEQSGPKQRQCSICKEVFNDAQVLRKHCLTHISGSSSNQCPFCKHNFSNRRYLLRHMIKHTGDKPFSCTNCGKQFYRDLYLKLHSEKCLPGQIRHLVTVESNTVESNTMESNTMESNTVESDTVESNTVESDTVETDTKAMGKLECSYCPRTFFKKNRLKNHHRGHKANTLLHCSRCGQYFGFTKLKQHQKNCRETQTTELNTDLSPNGDVSKRTSQASHVQMPSKSNATKMLNLKCPHCTQRFRYRSLLLRHLVSHTGVQPYACMHCGRRFGSRTTCLQHEAFCDGVYEQGQSKVKGDAATQSSRTPTLREAAQKPQAEGEAEYKCKFCTKTFMKSRSLRRHILTHNEVNPYRCKLCDSCFSRYDHLKVHQTRCRGKKTRLEVRIPKITLDDVGKGWQNKFGLEPAEKQETFECEVCSRSFPTQSKLSRHFTMFHATKLFTCTQCGSSFSHEKTLKKHRKMRRCHKVNKERNASLLLETNPPTENVTTPLRGVRNRIIQRIQPYLNNKYKYVCSYCPRAFGNSWQLGVHIRLHTGERPYACEYCGEKFIRKDYLQRHFVKCTKKPQKLAKSTVCQGQQSTSKSPPKGFSCAYCNSRFLLFSQLQEHFLNAHQLETQVPPVSTAPLQHHLSNIPNIKEEPLDESFDKQLSDGTNLICKLDPALDSEVPNPFSCPECNLSFTNKAGLTGHLRVHSTKIPFSCKTCKRGFWNKSLLRNHNRKCRFGRIPERSTSQPLEVPLKAEIDFVLNDSILVFKEASQSTGTGVLQTNFICKDDLMDESPQNSEENQVQNNSSKEKKAVQYQCSECDKSFTDGLMLISHLEDHGREEQAKKRNACVKCGQVFTSKVSLEKHMKLHGINRKFSCPDCPKVVYTSSELEIHRTCHDRNRPFVCKLCNQRFWTRPSLCNHYREEHPDDVFTCRFCNNAYSVKKSLARHYKRWHQQEQRDLGKTVQEKCSAEQQSSSQVSTTGESDEDGNNGSEDSDSDSAPYFPCHVCGKTFPTSESLEDHQRCHLGEKPHECEECGRCFFQASQLQQHQRMHKSEFQCQLCGRGFVSLFALRKHKHTHGKSRPYRCSKCDLSFTGPSQLAEHMSTHREENFPCDICNLVFPSKSSRAEHRKRHSKFGDHPPSSISREEHEKSVSLSESSSVSLKELKYRCGVCGDRFSDPEELSEHGCMAAKERPYSCSDCNKHFLHASHLKNHMTTHQLSWSNNEYPCNQCNNSFSSPQGFHSHLESHVNTAAEIKHNTEGKDGIFSHGFICPVCHQCFASATELICHFPKHPNGAFECKICKITFPSASKLEEHKQCHVISATEFECTVCGQSFLGRDAFHQHRCSHQPHATMKAECSNPSAKTSPQFYHQAAGEEEEVDVTGEDLHNCSVCSMQFYSKSGLLEHQNKQHRNEKPFKCGLCGNTFAKKRYLQEHERRHRQKHTAQLARNKFKCNHCPAEFNTTQDLSLHIRLHAEKEAGAFRCDMCYKSFSRWSDLKQHQESHVGQVVYECTECDKAFAFPHLLEEHQQTHAGSSQ